MFAFALALVIWIGAILAMLATKHGTPVHTLATVLVFAGVAASAVFIVHQKNRWDSISHEIDGRSE